MAVSQSLYMSHHKVAIGLYKKKYIYFNKINSNINKQISN